MGSRSRKRRREDAPPRLRGEERNEQIRAELEPLPKGERPTAVTVAAVVALLLAIANVVLLAVGYDIRGKETTSSGGTLAFAAIMLVAAVGMWQGRYWAVLGFQCLLALTAITVGLALLVASNVAAVVLSLAVLIASGTMFWFLIRAMARMQMPERPQR